MKKIIAVLLSCLTLLSLAACGEQENSNKGKTDKDGKTVWYLGGNNILAGDVNTEDLFEGVTDSIDPSGVYSSTEFTEKMLHGSYTLNNKDKDLKTVRKEIPFEDVMLKDGSTRALTILPTAVYLGVENMCNPETGYKYGEYSGVTKDELAVIEFATEDKVGQVPCLYELKGNKITFKQISKTSNDEEPLTYEETGAVFEYEFELCGPYMTFKKGDKSIRLKAFCFTDNTDGKLSMSGYSLLDSPLIDELDYFASVEAWNYAVRRDGGYYDLSAYKMTDDGRFTVYLQDKTDSGETVKFVEQYAYIIQSSASNFLTSFSIVLLDGTKAYYYTDNITQREAKALTEQGTDINSLTEDEIKEIAEKKSEIFDDLYKEFEAQGINATVNRSVGEIVMEASVLFGGDSAVITDDGKALLNKFLAAYISVVYNEKYDGFISKTVIEGHTAHVKGSTYESGLPLSEKRANNVKEYCLSADTGIDTSELTYTLEAVGLSNSRPIYGSDGKIDLTACRRVSFRIIVNTDK